MCMNGTVPPRPIIVGYEDTPQGRDALALGVALAGATGDPLILAGAYGPVAAMSQDELDERAAQIAGQLEEVAAGVRSDALPHVETTAVPGSSPAAALQTLSEALDARALVLGSCHRGPVGRVLVGSVAERLLNGAPCPVVVAPRGMAVTDQPRLRTICVGFDGRPESWTALQRAAQLARAAGARLRVVTALPPLTGNLAIPTLPPEALAERDRRAEIELNRAVESVSDRTEAELRLVRGYPQVVLEEQARDSDLLVTGSRGYGPLRRVLLGTVSTALMRSAAGPVMVVPRSTRFDPSGEGMAAEDELVETR
jgi:nucleotide-binding universal stress UspA family protein